MCLAIPVRIARIDENLMAEADLGGAGLTVSLALTPDARVGDYAIVHAGYAIAILDEAEARETLRLFAEMAQANEAIQEQGGEPA